MVASPLSGTEVHALHSDAIGDDFRVFLGWCGEVSQPAPVEILYLLDANGYFGAAVDIIRMLQLSAHLPPMLVVGVGYPVLDLRETVDQRTRDLTPTADPDYAGLVPTPWGMGGAPAFLQFLTDELRPWVAGVLQARGLTMSAAPTLFGHSLAGLFASYVLLAEPATFGRYAIGSPSLWWDKQVILSQERARAQRERDLPARVFLAVGSLETHQGRQLEASRLPAQDRAIAGAWPIDMVADTLLLADRLSSRGYPGLSLQTEVFEGEFHISVPPLTLSRALRALYDAPSPAAPHRVGDTH